ncbi:MAG TPA: urease accessory protein UreE [Polyangia bacterium]|nr:urease accessory protein UreE [Polyangia bacterium]
MREVKRTVDAGTPGASVTLTYDQRCKSRQRLTLDDGSEAALLLERGTVLEDGALLAAEDGLVIAVRAAPETLSVVRTEDPLALARAAYHLGNRHVPLQIRPGDLRYQHDHVLDDLVAALGLRVEVVTAPFQPEGGAYGKGHTHSHGSDHDHHHDH